MNTVDQNIENLFKNLQKETMIQEDSAAIPQASAMRKPVKLVRPIDFAAIPQADAVRQDNFASDAAATREELITLAESGKIKYTVNYIKKASHATLDKIKVDYERKHLDETNDYVANNILSSITEVLKYFNLVKNSDELKEDFQKNYLLKRDVKNIIGMVTPSIPYVGLLCGGVTVGKHVVLNALNESERSEPSQSRSETTE